MLTLGVCGHSNFLRYHTYEPGSPRSEGWGKGGGIIGERRSWQKCRRIFFFRFIAISAERRKLGFMYGLCLFPVPVGIKNFKKTKEFYDNTLTSVGRLPTLLPHYTIFEGQSPGPQQLKGLKIPRHKWCKPIIPTSLPCIPPDQPSRSVHPMFKCSRWSPLTIEVGPYTRV